MKVICPREGLLAASQLASAAVAVREVKPILRNLKAIAEDGRFTLMATDLEIGIRHEMRSLQMVSPGESILPAGKLVDILRQATDADQTIDAAEKKRLLSGALYE